jgi:signal transduction histidine kinase
MLDTKESGILDHLEVVSRLLSVGILAVGSEGELEYANPLAARLLGCADAAELRERWPALAPALGVGLAPALGVGLAPARGGSPALRIETARLEGGGAMLLVRARDSLDRADTDLLLAGRMRIMADLHRLFAHDLRAPLNSIQLSLELLAATLADGAAAPSDWGRHVAVMREELGRLNRLLEATLERGEPMGAAAERFDLRDALREIARLMKSQFHKRRVRVDVQLPDQPVWVQAPRDRLAQALSGVLMHACEATPGEGSVRMQLASGSGGAQLCIEGTGAVPREVLAQLEQAAFRPSEAAGAGLYVARRVLESLGGSLAADAVTGPGTRFTINLRLA